MFTIGNHNYSQPQLLDELRRQSIDDETGVVWHNSYTTTLPVLAAAEQTNFPKLADLLLSATSHMLYYTGAYRTHVESGARQLLAGHPKFERSGSPKVFNMNFWTQVGNGNDAFLRLKPRQSAYAAVRDLVENSGGWSLDCAAFVQAVALYARAMSVGQVAFDSERGDRPFDFNSHDSTGLHHQKIFFKEEQSSEWRLRTPATDEVDAKEPTCAVTETQLLQIAPVGSRIAFVNADFAAQNTDYERENCVKLLDGSFAAQPFGVVSTDSIKRKLAQQTILRYGDEIENNLRLGAEGKNKQIDQATAAEALVELDKLLKTADRDEMADWILAHNTWSDKLVYNDLDEYVDDLIYLAEVEIYTVTPEDAATMAFGV